MLEFLEDIRFNTQVRYGTAGSPEFSTEVVTVTSGAELRNANWPGGKGRWTVGDDGMNREEWEWLLSFFLICRGRARGFRFKDWSDFRATQTNSFLGSITDSTTTMQLQRIYARGPSQPIYRDITKPVPGTVSIFDLYGNEIDTGDYTVDYTTGIVTITPGWYVWEGEFDVPARFDSDVIQAEFAAYRDSDGETMYNVMGLSVVEIAKLRT